MPGFSFSLDEIQRITAVVMKFFSAARSVGAYGNAYGF